MSRVNEIAESVSQLPVFPEVVARLAQLADDPRADAGRVEAVIRFDPGLTANVLRAANAAYARGHSQIPGVREATVRLGLRRVLELAIADSLRAQLPAYLIGYAVSATTFLHHCAAVAVMCEDIGRRVEPGAAYFTAGLLHDMGKLVADGFIAPHAAEVGRQLAVGGQSFLSIEKSVLQTDHAELGLAVARRWNLPEPIAMAARYHHEPNLAPREYRKVACAVHVADGMAHVLGLGADVGELTRSVDGFAVDELGLDAQELEALCARSLEPLQALGLALTGA